MPRCKHDDGIITPIRGELAFGYKDGKLDGFADWNVGHPVIQFDCMECHKTFRFGWKTRVGWQYRIIDAFLDYTRWCG